MVSKKHSNLNRIFIVLTVIVLITTVKLLEKAKLKHDENGKKGKIQRWRFDEQETVTDSKDLLRFDEKKKFLKVFHLDLKGGPPKLSFLFATLPMIRKAGANAILIEYEDMFPFTGKLRNVSAGNAYPLEDLKALVRFAESLGMEVIPLVQSFGHLEYVLKLKEFQHLRELESFPQEICPSKKEAVDLIKELIRQVMVIHVNSRYVHIGCDEVRHLGACPVCSKTSSKKIFSKHVMKIGNYVRSQYPGVIPLIWDDMLRLWTFDDMDKSGLGSVVEPVIWVYGNNIFLLVPRFTWNIYLRIFPNLWVASAFKGAFGETEILPEIVGHFENTLSWKRVLTNDVDGIHFDSGTFSGIFVTGWSRYDHFAVLCELLPAGIPSLILSLIFLDRPFEKNVSKGVSEWLKILNCPQEFFQLDISTIEEEKFYQSKLGSCSFPGSNLYLELTRYKDLKTRMSKMLHKIESNGWISTYNLERNFTSSWRIIEMFPEEGFGGEILRKEIVLLKSSLIPIMTQYFDDYTVSEWVEQSIKPIEVKLKEIQTTFQKLIARKTWPRRPLG